MGQYMFMPKLDMSMEEGTVVEWLVKEGDKIEKGDYVVEVETGKVSIQVDNTVSAGIVLKIYAPVGETVAVNVPIMYIGKKGEIPPTAEAALDSASSEISARAEISNARIENHDYDLIVIGGGPGGYTCAIRAAQLGRKVLLIEKEVLGGVCLNRGCIPTKAFIKNAEVVQTVRNAGKMGVTVSGFTFDWSEVIERKNEVVTSLQRGIAVLLKNNNITILQGEASIVEAHKVALGEQIYTGASIVIASGSRQKPTELHFDESIRVFNSEEILDITQLPEAMIISGGGVIGIEMAYVFNEYGVKITIVEQNDRLLADADAEIAKILEREIRNSGIDIVLGREIVASQKDKVLLDQGEQIDAEAVLFTGQRKAVVPQCYDPLKVRDGFILIDEDMNTSISGIYAIGDCSGKMLTAHAAIRQGNVLAENLFGKKNKINYETIPTCLFSNPEAAWIGLTEEEARARKIPIKVSKTRFSSIGKALATAQTQGLVKVIADSRWDEIIGVHIIGANATDIIAQAAIAMTAELCGDDIANTVFAHPTFSEAFMDACGGLVHK